MAQHALPRGWHFEIETPKPTIMQRRRLRRRLSGTASEGLRKKFAPPRTCVPLPMAVGGGGGGGGGRQGGQGGQGGGSGLANSASAVSRQSGLPVAAPPSSAADTKSALESAQEPQASGAATVCESRGGRASPFAGQETKTETETLLRPADVIGARKGPRLAVGLQRRAKHENSLNAKHHTKIDSRGMQNKSSPPVLSSSSATVARPPRTMPDSSVKGSIGCDEDRHEKDVEDEDEKDGSSDDRCARHDGPSFPEAPVSAAALRPNSKRGLEAQAHHHLNAPHTPRLTTQSGRRQQQQQNASSLLQLQRWGLPHTVCAGYARQGVSQLYPWQEACLSGAPEVLDGRRHFLYSAPTSGGKTLVAEILLLRRILATGCRALLVLPYNSVVAEKTRCEANAQRGAGGSHGPMNCCQTCMSRV